MIKPSSTPIFRVILILIISLFEKLHVGNSQKFPTDGQLGTHQQPSLMSLISPRDIAELMQVGTQFGAQMLRSNGDVISKSGPEVQPVDFNARPSEIFGQSLTNMMHPARQNLANALTGQQQQSQTASDGNIPASAADENRIPFANNAGGGSLIEQLAGSFLGGTMREAQRTEMPEDPNRRESFMGMDKMVGQAMKLLTGAQNPTSSSNSVNSPDLQGIRQRSPPPSIPSLQQLFPGADKNFGFRQGEGCVPFIGEFMKMAYGNCVKRADERTWDTWGKEISNALMGGKIDLFRASKETCKMGAEREHCGQLRKAISECNILGSIQMATNLQRSVSRCDEVTGLIDQNPSTVFNQMNGLINGEMAQGFLNNFLG